MGSAETNNPRGSSTRIFSALGTVWHGRKKPSTPPPPFSDAAAADPLAPAHLDPHTCHAVLDVRAESWHDGASAFAEAAVRAGSPFATFFVGSVDFYTSNGADEASKARRKRGASLLAAAAVAGSKEAHHTLAIMHFNGSGGRRKDKDPESGAELCARGNILFGSVAAKRELGHCLQDGFGVEQDVALGRKLLAEAAKEDIDGAAMDTAVMAATAAAAVVEERLRKRNDINTLHAAIAAAAEVSAAAKAAAEAHLTATPASRFLLDWYGCAGHTLAPGIMACSHPLCGRVETRRHEFRRCSCCGRVRYCSRSCQSTDWRLQHKFACLPLLELYGWVESDVESQDSGAGSGSNSGAMDAVHAPAGDTYAAEVSSGR